MKTHELQINVSTPRELGFWLNFHRMSADTLHKIDTLPKTERGMAIERYFESVQNEAQNEAKDLVEQAEQQRQGEKLFMELIFTVIIKGLFEKHQGDKTQVKTEIREHEELFEPYKEIVNKVYRNEIHN